MRTIATLVRVLLVLVIAAASVAARPASQAEDLAGFARQVGLRDTGAFLATVENLRAGGRLPPRYVTKGAARAHGWHGGGLCAAWPEHAIGGDVFHNFAGRLPPAPGRVYREADLDATCRSRGPKRLIFSNDGLIFVTPDHYNTFVRVP